LRQAGIRISPPEVADALVAAGAVDLEDRPQFRSALRATLVKRDFDLDTFDQLFELYFSPYGSRDGDLPPQPELRELPPLRLRAAVRGFVRAEYDRNEGALRENRRARELSMRSIAAFTPREAAEMSRLVERLGQKFDSLPELRRAPRKRGALDMHRTWRSNLQTGGVPFRLRWEKPPQRRPQ